MKKKKSKLIFPNGFFMYKLSDYPINEDNKIEL